MKAHIAFLDETGVLMAPLVRRSWAPRGQRPVLYQRTRSHQKVSVIGALCVTPLRDRCHFYFRTHPGLNINGVLVAAFVGALLRQLREPVFLIWDHLASHRGKEVKLLAERVPRLHLYLLPPYAPELNPVENAWSYWKLNPLANSAPMTLEELSSSTSSSGRSIQRRRNLLWSFIEHSPLSTERRAA